MNARASAGESKRAISAMSAPPMKDLDPAPVSTTQRRSAFWEVRDWRVWGRASRREVLRAFSLVGREIVTCAIVPVLRRVRVVRIEGGVRGMVIYDMVLRKLLAELCMQGSLYLSLLEDRKSPILNAGKGYEMPRKSGDIQESYGDRANRTKNNA